MKTKKRLVVGKRYQTQRSVSGLRKARPVEFYTIVYKEGDDAYDRYNYIGLSDDGIVVRFNSCGKDTWYEFGGRWWELDLATETKGVWSTLIKL